MRSCRRLVDAMDTAARFIQTLYWPTETPVLVAICFAIALACWRLKGDVVAAYVFGFSAPFLFWWTVLLVWGGLEIAFYEYPVVLDAQVLYGEAVVAAILFLTCSVLAVDAMATSTRLRHPVRVVGLLIAAVTLHFHIVFSWIFKLFQAPLLELRLLRLLFS